MTVRKIKRLRATACGLLMFSCGSALSSQDYPEWVRAAGADEATKSWLTLCAANMAARFDAISSCRFRADYTTNYAVADDPNSGTIIRRVREYEAKVAFRRPIHVLATFVDKSGDDREEYGVIQTPKLVGFSEWHFQEGPFLLIDLPKDPQSWRRSSRHLPFLDPTVFFCAGYAANSADVFKQVVANFPTVTSRKNGDVVQIECNGKGGRMVFDFDSANEYLPLKVMGYGTVHPTKPDLSFYCEWQKMEGRVFPSQVSRHAGVGRELEDVETDKLVIREVALNEKSGVKESDFTLSSLPQPEGATALDRRTNPPTTLHKMKGEFRELKAGESLEKLPKKHLDRLKKGDDERRDKMPAVKEQEDRDAREILASRQRNAYLGYAVYAALLVAVVAIVLRWLRKAARR